jgi:hypothetical protein
MPRLIRRPGSTVQSRATTLEAELTALRQLDAVIIAIQNLKRKFPKLIEEFAQHIHCAVDDAPPDEEPQPMIRKDAFPSGERKYGIEKLVEWFRSRNNEPATAVEMAAGIGLSLKAVKSMIYERNKEKFVTLEQRGRNNTAYFRLADA